MRTIVLAFALIAACKYDRLPMLGGDDAGGGDDGGGSGSDACIGIGCNVETCDVGDETRITGRVLLPNGLTPMANVDVYVPATDPGAMPIGPQCVQCGQLPGNPVRRVLSDSTGGFSLTDVPSGDNIPLVVTIGKWRRQIVIPHVNACEETVIPDAMTRLPKNRTEGDMPRIAVTTGQADALECLVRKIGIDDTEFGVAGSQAAIHMFAPTQAQGGGTNRFATGGNFMDTGTLWSSLGTLMNYDAVILSCEGTQQASSKPQTAMIAMQDYANSGGRIFATHFQSIWIGGEINNPGHAPPEWGPPLAEFVMNGTNPNGDTFIDLSTAEGMAFGAYQQAVTSVPLGRITMLSGSQRSSVMMLDTVRTRRVATSMSPTGTTTNFTFTTPIDSPGVQKCGRVAFSDMHQGSNGNSMPSVPFPNECNASPLAPQDVALVYLIFDLQRCVSGI